MLAQNFKTAADLGISEAGHGALVKVLGMLERGEIVHAPDASFIAHLKPDHGTAPVGFNMGQFYAKANCGTACCICGWAEFVGMLEPGSLMLARFNNDGLHRLFDPTGTVDVARATPSAAATALRSYLSTGEANWAEAIASQ